MSQITVRVAHYHTFTPIMEVEISPKSTVGELKSLIEGRLVGEEKCLVRVFGKWYANLEFGGRRRPIEITEDDAHKTLAEMKFEDDTIVLLDGPLTGSVDGVGQAVAVLGENMRRQNTQTNQALQQLLQTDETLRQQTTKSNAILLQINQTLQLILQTSLDAEVRNLKQEVIINHQDLKAQEDQAFAKLILAIGVKTWAEFVLSTRFLIDKNLPSPFTRLTDSYTVTKSLGTTWQTYRATAPLSPSNNLCAFRIVNGSQFHNKIMLGLLPELTQTQVDQLSSMYLGQDGFCGWGHYGQHKNYGAWSCPNIAFKDGAIVGFCFNFTSKKLRVRCGGECVESSELDGFENGDKVYPAISLCHAGQVVEFVPYPY